MDISVQQLLIGSAAALFVGLTKTGVPGLGILIAPLMVMAFPARQSVGAVLLMLLVGDLFAVGYYRRYTQWNKLWGLFPAVAVGLAAGAAVLSRVDDSALKPMLGWLVLGMLGVELARKRFGWTDVPHKWWFVLIVGFLAGFTTTVGNLAGPVMSIYLI
ncbi:MAG: sulfite exporter TauE/SafE family protein, partial [Candidatus Hydrogenedentes bacterium]|nr:sulfite exporter TauE/SafE family protein [Candidatus Hydrogenedentota bacterium]